MVLEQLYQTQWLERKNIFAFLLGLSYSIIGIASAIFIFPEDPGLMAVAFTSLLLLPSLNKLLEIEENQAARENKFNLYLLYKDHKDIFGIYLFMFIGMLISFGIFAVGWPAITTSKIFSQQVSILGGAGLAAGAGAFRSILANNLSVLVFCFIASFVYGAGSIFVITWNASVWGVIFGIIAKNSALAAHQNPFSYFFLTIIAVFPHMILEASSYFLVAISGGIVSTATVREKLFSRRFTQIIQDSLIVFVLAVVTLVLAAYIEVYVTGYIVNLFGL